MRDKSKDFHGKLVSKEEVLKELGDPATWGRDERKSEFRSRLRGGQKELDISGIRGYGKFEGYLSYLRNKFKHPFGVSTGLVSEGKDVHIEEQEKEAIKEEIEKYVKLLKKLEKSSKAIEQHISQIKYWLDYKRKEMKMDPEKKDDEELKELAINFNKELDEELGVLEIELKEYELLLKKLRESAS